MDEYLKYIIFEKLDSVEIKRPEKFGGDILYESYNDLEKDYLKGKLNPADLKPNVGRIINELIKPVRDYFDKDEGAKKMADYVKNIQK